MLVGSPKKVYHLKWTPFQLLLSCNLNPNQDLGLDLPTIGGKCGWGEHRLGLVVKCLFVRNVLLELQKLKLLWVHCLPPGYSLTIIHPSTQVAVSSPCTSVQLQQKIDMSFGASVSNMLQHQFRQALGAACQESLVLVLHVPGTCLTTASQSLVKQCSTADRICYLSYILIVSIRPRLLDF